LCLADRAFPVPAREAPTDDPDVAVAWLDHLFSGQARACDWLSTRTCKIHLGGPRNEARAYGRAEIVALTEAFGCAFETPVLTLGTVFQREHQIVVDVSIEATHTGRLDLTELDGPAIAATGRRLALGPHRLAWQILHQRVHEFEVQQGPGLDPTRLARQLEPSQASPNRPRPERANLSSGWSEATTEPDEDERVSPALAAMPDVDDPGSTPVDAGPGETPDADGPGDVRDEIDALLDEQF
jgi:hypothetical protein